MALKSDDILLVQRGDQSYQMPASQLGTSEVIAQDLQAVTENGNTTNQGIKVVDPGQGIESYHGFFSRSSFNSKPSTTQTGSVLFPSQLLISSNAGTPSSHAIFQSFLTTDSEEKIRLSADGAAKFGASNISLNADGSSLFKGPMEIQEDSSPYFQFGYGTDGSASHRIQWDSGGFLLSADPGQDAPSSRINFSVHGTTRASLIDDGSFRIGGTLPNSPNTTLNADGSAKFLAGTSFVEITNDKDINFSRLDIQNNYGNDSTSLLIGKDGTTNASITNTGGATFGTGNIELSTDGSASFAGGDSTLNKVADGAAFNVRNNSTGQAIGVYDADMTSGSRVISLNGDGSALFKGEVNTNNANGIASNSCVSIKNSRIYTRSDSGSYTTNVFAAFKGGDATSNIVANIHGGGGAFFDQGVTGSVATIAHNTTWDMIESNYWTTPGPTLGSPTNATAGQTGVIYCSGEVNAFGGLFSFPGGATPTIPANSIVQYYVDTNDKVRLGIATEAFV